MNIRRGTGCAGVRDGHTNDLWKDFRKTSPTQPRRLLEILPTMSWCRDARSQRTGDIATMSVDRAHG